MSNLFRQKSLDRISSPEQLNTYIRVATPSVWLLLSAIVILLTGVCVWGVFGHMDTTVSAVAVSADGVLNAYVREMDVEKIMEENPVIVDEVEGAVKSVSKEPVRVDEDFTEYMRHLGGLQEGEWVYAIELDAVCTDGVYEVQIVVDSVSPMSFVLN